QDRQKVQQLVDRFEALMAEHRWQLAHDEIAPELQRLAFLSPIESSVMTGGLLQGQNFNNQITWRAREKAVLKTLYQVELALVPFPDEPPIVYMPADKWEDLAIRRQKYKAVDLGK